MRQRRAGRFTAPMGDSRLALVDVRDAASVAASVLVGEGCEGATLIVSGPEALSYGEAAREIGAAVGKEVSYAPADPHAFLEGLVSGRGLPRWRAEELASVASAYDGGVGEQVTDVVLRIGGTPPRSFAGFVNEYADHFVSGLSHHM